MVLANENDIYIFFEIIDQMEPRSILDMGMFLKRIGSISRKVMNREVAKGIWLEGVDFFTETRFPVWENVYDEMIDYEVFFESRSNRRYDLTILLGVDEIQKKVSMPELLAKAEESSRYALIDHFFDTWKTRKNEWKVTDLKVEREVYYLIDFGE